MSVNLFGAVSAAIKNKFNLAHIIDKDCCTTFQLLHHISVTAVPVSVTVFLVLNQSKFSEKELLFRLILMRNSTFGSFLNS